MIRLHVPGAPPRALRWTNQHPNATHAGVLLFRHSGEILDGARFRELRDAGAWIETDRPERVRRALHLAPDEGIR